MSAPQPGFRVTTLHAFLAVDEDDEEGICGFLGPNGWLPMIGSDKVRIEVLRPMAADVARATGRPVRLVEFSTRTDVEELVP